jgi:uncharacterized delta-60 repeat protein
MTNPSLLSQFVRWLSSCRSRQPGASRPGRARPTLESLEVRLTPAPYLAPVATFGTGGTVLTQFMEHVPSAANGVVVQPDGKVVVVGEVGGPTIPGIGFVVTRYNADGSPDKSFGPNHNGRVITPFANPAGASAVALQRDGKILVAGATGVVPPNSGSFALARYNTDGSLDKTFGSGGEVTTSFASQGPNAMAIATSIVIDSAGRIVLGGTTFHEFALTRYTANGSLDKSFGTGGKVLTNVGGMSLTGIDALALDAQGRIVAAGFTNSGKDALGDPLQELALARYKTNGSLDTTFGSGGEVITTFRTGNAASANGMVIQHDGKIVVGGFTYNRDTGLGSFALARFTTGGSRDRTFGTGGAVVTSFGHNPTSGILAVALDALGRIVAAGYTLSPIAPNPTYSQPNIALARYNTSGALDTAFGSGGEVVTAIAGGLASARAIACGPQGQILVVGSSSANSSSGDTADFALERYKSNGSLDKSFGTAGLVRAAFTEHVGSTLDAVAAQPDGKLVAFGSLAGLGNHLGMLRLNKDGSLDTTFGSGGQVIDPFPLFSFVVHIAGVVVQPDGKIVVATTEPGYPGSGIGPAFLTRFNPNGSVDTSFGLRGETDLNSLHGLAPGSVPSVQIAGVVVQADGKILLAVSAGSLGLDIVRFNKDGSQDASFGSNHTGGIVTAFPGPTGCTLALESDGKIVVTGLINGDLALARYNADGSTDKTFGAAGVVHTSIVAVGVAGVVFQPGGKIVVAGSTGTQKQFFVARFSANGSLDRTFGTGGEALASFTANYTASNIATDSSGQIFVAGYSGGNTTASPIYVASFSTNGQPQMLLGTAGMSVLPFPLPSGSSTGAGVSLVLEPQQGTLVVAGTKNPTSGAPAIGLAEYWI